MRGCDVLRVFTRGDDGGNHLGVVTDLDGLDGSGMQDIAASLGFSETIFVESGASPAVRIFTPAAELPFAGHPLVGAAWALGASGIGSGTMRCGIGEVAFRAAEDRADIEVPMAEEVAVAADSGAIAAAAGLPRPERGWWVRMPISYLVLEMPSPAAVRRAEPDPDALAAGPAGDALYLVAESESERITARFFAPGLGVFEDPATGSAAAALAAVRVGEGNPTGAVTIHQGDEIGHPSTIELAWRPGVCMLGGTVRRDGVRELTR